MSEDFACPTCDGQSVAESNAVVAQEIRREIRRQVDAGASDQEITEILIAGYDESIDLRPRASGLVGLVWMLPVFALVFASAGLVAAFRRWQVAPAAAGAADEPVPARPSWGGRAAWVATVVVVAVGAALAMAAFSGARGSGDTATGEIRQSTVTLLADAAAAFGQGDPERAIELYDEVLELQPTNVEARTYRGWVRYQTGDVDAARVDFDEVVSLDPAYADVRVFRAVDALDLGEFDRAAGELDAFDQAEPNAVARGLVEQRRLRERITAGLILDVLAADAEIDLVGLGIEVGAAQAAGELFVNLSQPAEALATFDAVLAADPGNAAALAWRGWTLALAAESGATELFPDAERWLDEAVTADPGQPDARVFRAFLFLRLERPDEAREELAAFDLLEVQPPDLLQLIDDFDLRESLAQ